MAERRWSRRINWFWVPAAAAGLTAQWYEHGPWVALACVPAGLGLAAFLNYRARRRQGPQPPTESN